MISFLRTLFFNAIFIADFAMLLSYECLQYALHRQYHKTVRSFAHNLAKRNILYVKLFQAIAFHEQYLDDKLNQELLTFTDSVPYGSEDEDLSTLLDVMREHGVHNNKVFPLPIKAGMISLVYKMRDAENKDVIVKMKRKNIDARLKESMEHIIRLIEIAAYIPYIKNIHLSQTICKNMTLIKEQLDFQKEVNNTREMSEICKHMPYIKIPKVYEDITQKFPNVIVMEYIDGVHISKVDKEDYHSYAKLVVTYGVVSLLNSGITHGDLHPGNILFIKNKEKTETQTETSAPIYQIGLIDFGVVIRLHERMKVMFLELATTMFSEPGYNVAKKILHYFFDPMEAFEALPDSSKEQMYNVIGPILDDAFHVSKQANQIKLFEGVQCIHTFLQNQNQTSEIRISEDFLKLQMGLAMAHGVSMSLCNEDYIPFVNKVLHDLLHIDLLTI